MALVEENSTHKPANVKVTPISDLESQVAQATGIALSDSPPRMTWECSCSCRAVTERGSGNVVLRCPDCGLIQDIWRGADRLQSGTYCQWCGLVDSEISMGVCANRSCHPRRRALR